MGSQKSPKKKQKAKRYNPDQFLTLELGNISGSSFSSFADSRLSPSSIRTQVDIFMKEVGVNTVTIRN